MRESGLPVRQPGATQAATEPDTPAVEAAEPPSRAGLNRRVPGSHLHTTVRVPERRISQPRTSQPRTSQPRTSQPKPAAGSPAPGSPCPGRAGLAADSRAARAGRRPDGHRRPRRDPAAERDALNDFLSGAARGEAAASAPADPSTLLPERHT
ncbi:hypothetical protein ACFQX7_32615 [Luedemannella flava]